MKLIDIYVSEVGRQLPQKGRADIEAEIRSALQDMLEAHSLETGKPVDDELTQEVLKQFGDPRKVAASYLGDRYLIGPQLFPTFITVFKIVLTIFFGLALFSLIFKMTHSVFSAQNLFNGIAGLGTSFITALGNVVLIFAIIEWATRNQGLKFITGNSSIEKTWDPSLLKKISLPDRVKMGEFIADIVFTFAAILIFNFYPQVLAVYGNINGAWTSSAPIFTTLFFSRFVPWLTLIWGLDILVNSIVLRMGSWNLVTRLSNAAVRAGTIVILLFLLRTPGLLNISVTSLVNTAALSSATAETLATLARQGFASVLIIIIILEGIEIVKHLWRLVNTTKSGF